MMEYHITHPPVVLMLPYYNSFLTTAPTWPWWQLQTPETTFPPPGGSSPPP